VGKAAPAVREGGLAMTDYYHPLALHPPILEQTGFRTVLLVRGTILRVLKHLFLFKAMILLPHN
jgi:hypothetical protein